MRKDLQRLVYECLLEKRLAKEHGTPTHSMSDLAIVNDRLMDYTSEELLLVAMLRLNLQPEATLAEAMSAARARLTGL